jgi:hypothetical protein
MATKKATRNRDDHGHFVKKKCEHDHKEAVDELQEALKTKSAKPDRMFAYKSY